MRPEPIHDPSDPRLDPFRIVAEPDLVRGRGQFVAEGRRVVEILLEAHPAAIEQILLTRSALSALEDPLARGLGPDAPVYVLDGPAALRSVTGVRFHQGCLALAALPPPRTLASLSEDGGARPRLVVGLERVTDPDNVGAIFRSAAAFGAQAVLLSPGCAHPLYRKALRNSLGTALRLPFVEPEAWGAELEALQRDGTALWALTPGPGAVDLDRLLARGVPERVLLLLGSEAEGLEAETLERADERVRIGIESAVDSLNVAAAAAVALHAIGAARRPA